MDNGGCEGMGYEGTSENCSDGEEVGVLDALQILLSMVCAIISLTP